MKKLITVTSLLLLCVAIHAQTFVCTDVNFYDSEITDRVLQERKKEALGSKAVLSFFDKNLKITITDGDGDVESLVLDRVNDSEYQVTNRRNQQSVERIEIKLSKLFEYIRSFTIKQYKRNSLIMDVTFKRD